MSEIDVSKCAFHNNGKCNNPNGMACNCCNNAYCYYKQLQQLKQENGELKNKLKMQKNKQIIVECGKRSLKNILHKYTLYQQCLDEIEECIKCCATTLYGCVNCKKGDECNGALSDLILQLIKQAKEGE